MVSPTHPSDQGGWRDNQEGENMKEPWRGWITDGKTYQSYPFRSWGSGVKSLQKPQKPSDLPLFVMLLPLQVEASTPMEPDYHSIMGYKESGTPYHPHTQHYCGKHKWPEAKNKGKALPKEKWFTAVTPDHSTKTSELKGCGGPTCCTQAVRRKDKLTHLSS